MRHMAPALLEGQAVQFCCACNCSKSCSMNAEALRNDASNTTSLMVCGLEIYV